MGKLRKPTFPKAFITFRKAFLASFSFGPPRTMLLLTTIRGPVLESSPRNALPVPLNPPLPFSSPHLAALEWSGLQSILVVVPCTKNSIFHHQCNLVLQLLRLWAHCPNSSSIQSSTMKVLFVLPPCPFTRSEGFSIELFGVQNNSTNTVLTASNV